MVRHSGVRIINVLGVSSDIPIIGSDNDKSTKLGVREVFVRGGDGYDSICVFESKVVRGEACKRQEPVPM